MRDGSVDTRAASNDLPLLTGMWKHPFLQFSERMSARSRLGSIRVLQNILGALGGVVFRYMPLLPLRGIP